MSAVLNREVFRTSRELEYFTEKELRFQTGHEPERWPEVVLKELVDNGLDACEGAGVLPEIKVTLDADSITVTDNGPGLPSDVIKSVLDFSVRASSKDHYISPTRGAQGNALKTVVAIPYVISDCRLGELEIIAGGERHLIRTSIDRIAQRPTFAHTTETTGHFVKNGTSVKVLWPDLARYLVERLSSRFLQTLTGYSLFNPHASFELNAFGTTTRFERIADTCEKWLTNEQTSPHWYTPEQLRNLIAAYVHAEQSGAPPKTVRAFISEFRGLSATAKQKAITNPIGLSDVYLRDLIKDDDIDRQVVERLLRAMKLASKPVKPLSLGCIGENRLRTWFESNGVALQTFKYFRTAEVDDARGLPTVLEVAFAVRESGGERNLITGINWSPTLINPFRSLGNFGVSLDGFLSQRCIERRHPVTVVLHLASPQLNYTDRGKASLEVA